MRAIAGLKRRGRVIIALRRALILADGRPIFGDLIGKLGVLRVARDQCGRAGNYPLHALIKSCDHRLARPRSMRRSLPGFAEDALKLDDLSLRVGALYTFECAPILQDLGGLDL